MKKLNLILLCGLSSIASATLLVEETFNYADGNLGTTTANGTGVTGNWQQYSNGGGAATADIVTYNWLDNGGITNYGYTPSTKALSGTASGGSNDAASINLDGVTIDWDSEGSVYYYSLLAKDVGNSNGGLIGFSNTSLNWWEIQTRMAQDVGAAYTGYIGGTGVGNMFTGADTDALIVGRITTSAAGNDTLETFFVAEGGTLNLTSFDSNIGIQSNSAAVTGTSNTLSAWNFQGNGNLYGDVRLGTTFESVTIPEPSTLLLVLGALGALAVTRRRR